MQIGRRFPDFLVIGAMKAGTTTLYADLERVCSVFFPVDKEPNNLADDEVLSDRGRDRYAALYASARPDQLCGDASTAYSKLPDIRGVPERAVTVLGDLLRVVYLVRDPVERAISHHHHLVARRQAPADIEKAIREIPALVDYGLYCTQINPWIDAVGRNRVQVLQFEHYMADREGWIHRVARFIGADPPAERIDMSARHNMSAGLPVAIGWRGALRRSRPYKHFVRPRLSRAARARLGAAVLPKAPDRPAPPSAETLAYLVDRLTDDVERLRILLGREAPLWDLTRYTAGSGSPPSE